MKIHFCDICNESVPQADLDRGAAVLRKGRVVCRQCDEAMSAGLVGAGEGVPSSATGSPAPSSAPVPESSAPTEAGSGFATVLASIAVLLVAGLYYLVEDRMRRVEQEVGRFEGLEQDLWYTQSSLSSDVNAARTDSLQEVQTVQVEVADLRAETRRTIDQHQEITRSLGSDLERIDTELGRLETISKDLSRHGGDLLSLQSLLTQVRRDLGNLAERLQAVEDSAIETVLAEIDAPDGPPVWAGLIDELAAASSTDRWRAVQAMGETGDLGVVAHLVPVLHDDDIFVRMATARVLGELRAFAAIPALIEALDDEEASVREQAMVSLRTLSGRNFKFDPNASANDRKRRTQAWKDWWKRAAEELIGEEPVDAEPAAQEPVADEAPAAG